MPSQFLPTPSLSDSLEQLTRQFSYGGGAANQQTLGAAASGDSGGDLIDIRHQLDGLLGQQDALSLGYSGLSQQYGNLSNQFSGFGNDFGKFSSAFKREFGLTEDYKKPIYDMYGKVIGYK